MTTISQSLATLTNQSTIELPPPWARMSIDIELPRSDLAWTIPCKFMDDTGYSLEDGNEFGCDGFNIAVQTIDEAWIEDAGLR